ncbi:16171_t:CDS:2 [Gigaspora margarita]|uniref:16171_t:CDS:1 n=1 Tax=Gigaspora margarita TaxID=4874 RepID=A0ABM8VVN8_GIGMA|nr:16171_t:CDS:2 [Gigaspora margarita]
MSSNKKVSIVSTSSIDKGKKVVKNIGGHPEGKQVAKGKYEAIYNLYGVTWNRANHCQKADSTTINQFLTKILSNNSEQGEFSKKRKINTQGPLDQYVSLIKLDN